MEKNTVPITEIITQTLNTLLENLFSSIDHQVYSLLDDIIFINGDILQDKHFEQLLGTSLTTGLQLLASSLLFGFVLYYIVKFILSHFVSIPHSSPRNFLFKLLFISISLSSCFFFCEQFVSIISLISSAIREIGEILLKKNICFSQLITDLNSTIFIGESGFNIFSFDGMLKSFISIALLRLIFSYSFRYILIKVLLLLTPFSICSLLNDSTSWFFKTWFRSILALLCIQILVSIILVILFCTPYESNNILSKFVYIGGLYTLIKSNSIIRDLVGGLSTDITQTGDFVSSFLGGKK